MKRLGTRQYPMPPVEKTARLAEPRQRSESNHPLAKFEERLISIIRMDLQLHFFWSFSLTILGLFWPPLFGSGIVVTIGKEALDKVVGKGWSWGDFWFGIAGAGAGLLLASLL